MSDDNAVNWVRNENTFSRAAHNRRQVRSSGRYNHVIGPSRPTPRTDLGRGATGWVWAAHGRAGTGLATASLMRQRIEPLVCYERRAHWTERRRS
jgi:hypothetical protein